MTSGQLHSIFEMNKILFKPRDLLMPADGPGSVSVNVENAQHPERKNFKKTNKDHPFTV